VYVVANRVHVKAVWAEEFETRFRNRAGQIEQQAGFVRMEILKPADDDSPYVVLTRWENQAAFNAWVGSEDFRAAHRNPMPKEAFSAPGQMERHVVVLSAAP
jgi:heme-degrading monooxygenase HmoA